MTQRRRVAIVSPYFPPSNLAGVHRARLLAAHLPSYSWDVVVICVHERCHEQTIDPELNALVPQSVRVLKTGAVSSLATRLFGIGDIGIRAYWHLEKAVSQLLSRCKIDMLFITTSPYYNALAGPRLKRRFGVPFVVDFQDPWISRWGETLPLFSKGGISHLLATWLEPRVIRYADHVTSVSDAGNEEILARYPALPAAAVSAIPIGGEVSDYAFLPSRAAKSDEVYLDETEFHFSYVGTIWPRCYPALRAVLMALARMKVEHPALYASVRLNFIGTSGRPDDTTSFCVTAEAMKYGVSERITEVPQRLGYLKALSILSKTSATLVIGSDEPHYTASKLFANFASGHPMLAVFHAGSSACDVVRRVGGGKLVTFVEREDPGGFAQRILSAMLEIVGSPHEFRRPSSTELDLLSADFMAKSYAGLFDAVVENGCRQPWW